MYLRKLRFSLLCIEFVISLIVQSNAHGYDSPLCNGPTVCVTVCTGASNSNVCTSLRLGLNGGGKDGAILIYPNNTQSNSIPSFTEFGDTCPFTSHDANILIEGIQKAITFYENNYQLLVAKTFYGLTLKMLQGHLNQILLKEKTPANLKRVFQKWLISCEEYSAKLFELAKHHEEIPEILEGINIIGNNTEVWISPKRNQPWKLHDIISNHETFVNLAQEKDYHNAYLNFECLVSIAQNCEMSDLCLRTQTKGVASQYKLTHQVLFLQFAEQRSCIMFGKNDSRSIEWDKLRNELCSKVYQESEFIAKNNFSIRYRHLFAQQITFCGSAGYPNFFRSDWLHLLLSLQSKGMQGCVTDYFGNTPNLDKVVNITNEKDGQQFTEACLVRTTSMVLSALALNLRYLADACSPDIFKDTL